MSEPFLTLLLADGRLPTGAHTQSAGVEPALRHGLELAALPEYIAARLTTVTETEAAVAVLARHVWRRAADPDALEAVDRAWRTRTASDAVREASDLLGRSFLRLAATVWDLGPLTHPSTGSGHRSTGSGLRSTGSGHRSTGSGHRSTGSGHRWCRPVVIGVTAAVAGLAAVETARLIGYDDVQTAIAAALKLRPFDPAIGVSWAVAAGPAVEALVDRVAGLTAPEEIPARAAPQLEEWAQLHRVTERRLFRA